jgi:hypothetical protein
MTAIGDRQRRGAGPIRACRTRRVPLFSQLRWSETCFRRCIRTLTANDRAPNVATSHGKARPDSGCSITHRPNSDAVTKMGVWREPFSVIADCHRYVIGMKCETHLDRSSGGTCQCIIEGLLHNPEKMIGCVERDSDIGLAFVQVADFGVAGPNIKTQDRTAQRIR